MTVVIVGIVVAWVIFSGFLVTIICMNSARLSRIDEPFKDPAKLARARRKETRVSIHGEHTFIGAEY